MDMWPEYGIAGFMCIVDAALCGPALWLADGMPTVLGDDP